VVAVTAAPLLLLSACGGNAPGVAASVGDQTITDREVDDFAEVLCSMGQVSTGQGQPGATKTARQLSLQILLANALAEQVADVDAVDRSAVEAGTEQRAAARQELSADEKAVFDDVVPAYVRAQTAILDLGRADLEEAGTEGEISDDDAYARGEELRTDYARRADIEVDPRFGVVTDGVLKPANGSLSVPVSELAVKGAEDTAPASYVSLLPAAQTCG